MNRPRQPADFARSTTRTVFGSTARMLRTTEWSSRASAPPCARIAWSVKMKSRAVTGAPSLQRASGRMRYVSVKGGFLVNVTPDTSLGWNVNRRSISNGDSRTFSATGF